MKAEDMPLLVESSGDALYGFCRKLERSKDDADELFQQTFLCAMELCHKIDLQYKPQSYLFGIAVKIWQGKRTKARRRANLAPQVPLDDTVCTAGSAPSAQDEAQRKMLTEHLSALANGLPDKFRVVLLMYYGCSLPLADIAAALKLPEGTVKSRLFKARNLMKKGLEADGYESFE